MKGSSIPLVFLICAMMVNTLPGSAGAPVGSCPTTEGAIPVYLTDSVNCEIFYECAANGYFVQQYCPLNPEDGGKSRLHWNTRLTTCDYPRNADCNL